MTNRKLYIIIGILAAVIIGGGVYIYSMNPGSEGSAEEENLPPYVVPSLSKPYENAKYKFSLMMPADFSVKESSMDGQDTIVFENAKSEGIQIVVSSFDDINVLTKEMILADIPDMQITEEQSVEIGLSHKGIAFKSDNPAFNGKSREVWFVFQKKLYQVSTYERFDGLLQQMFATWKFNAGTN